MSNVIIKYPVEIEYVPGQRFGFLKLCTQHFKPRIETVIVCSSIVGFYLENISLQNYVQF